LYSCGAIPTSLRASRHCASVSRPKIAIEPELFLTSATMALIVVVFPAPLGPRKPKKSPASTRNETSSTAVRWP